MAQENIVRKLWMSIYVVSGMILTKSNQRKAEKIDEQWQLVMRSLRSKPNTYLIHENYYHMVREMKQVMEKYKMI